MLELTIMRHAHAPLTPLGDFYRTLDATGQRQAHDQGITIKKLAPEIILTSHSKRTLDTLSIIHQYHQAKLEVKEEVIYTASEYDLLSLLELADAYDTNKIMILGHNPSVSLFSLLLSKSNSSYNKLMQPAEIRYLQFNYLSWRDIKPHSSTLSQVFYDTQS